MNKKFFTLIASVLMLVGFVGTASAQTFDIERPTTTAKLKNGGKYQIAITTKSALESVLGSVTWTAGTVPATPITYPEWASSSVPGASTTQAANQAATHAQRILNQLNRAANNFAFPAPWNTARVLWFAWIDKDGYLKGDPANKFSGKYYESIFCVNYAQKSNQGQNSTISILNWANQTALAVDPNDAVKLAATAYPKLNGRNGLFGDWGYSATYTDALQHWRPLYIYEPDNRDSVYVFVADMANAALAANTGNPLKLVKIGAGDLYTNKLPTDALLFEFVEPAPRVLTAEDFNTKLGSQLKATSQKLTFWGDKETVVNATGLNFIPTSGYAPWGDFSLHAVDVNTAIVGLPGGNINHYPGGTKGTPGTALMQTPITGTATGNWLYFQRPSDKKFLYLDTAYYGSANDNLKFNWNDTAWAYAGRTDITAATWLQNTGTAAAPKYPGNIDTTNLYLGKPNYASDFINQYRFQATYYWTEDSLAIDIAAANVKPQSDVRKFWQVAPINWEAPAYTANNADANATANRRYLEKKTDPTLTTHPAWTSGDLLHVKLLDLVTGTNVLTIGDRPINTRIKFGITDCAPQDNNRVTIPEGVYVIYSKNGKILHAPIYGDSTTTIDTKGKGVLWVSPKDNVAPHRMPSYHWVIKRVNPNDTEHSPILITNREFPQLSFRLTLTTEGDVLLEGEKIGTNYSTKADWNKSGVAFQHVDPALLKGDAGKYLGYFYIDPATATISKYELNYFNQFLTEQNHVISTAGGEKDTSLEVNTSRKLQFRFYPQSTPRYYGYVPTENDVKTLGIDTLWRTAYLLSTTVVDNDGTEIEKYLVINKERRYALSRFSETGPGTAGTGYATFLFKANNFAQSIEKKDPVDFYAMLDTTSQSISLPAGNVLGRTYAKDGTSGIEGRLYDLRYVKLGVPEDTKWIYEQVQDEQRTSAFAVTSYTPPLYRRFDNNFYKKFGYETEEEVQEPFGDTKDSPLYLKFTRQNNFGFEYLFENSSEGLGNNNKGGVGGVFDADKKETTENDYRQKLSAYGKDTTSFLGYYNIGQYPEIPGRLSYDFYVDTAYSRRPAIGSNSDAFTPKPQYMLALRAQYYPASKIIYDGNGHWHYPDGTPVPGLGEDVSHIEVDIPAVTAGFYLYNAQDSVNTGKTDFQGKPEYGVQNTTRLAFVRGFHIMGCDSFFVIPSGIERINGVAVDYTQKTDLDLIRDYNLLVRTLPAKYHHWLGENTHYQERYTTLGAAKANNNNGKAMVFQFRLISDKDGDRRFLIETANNGQEYGPTSGKWLRWENGVPVITDQISYYNASTLAHNGADIFNVVAGDGGIANDGNPASKDKATANEAATVEGAKVISGTGSVTILNAAGKTVTVTNVLGQVVAKTVATSDNATIALPKGIVVVSVDGNSSKALVK